MSQKLKDGPPLEYFIANNSQLKSPEIVVKDKSVSYIDDEQISGAGRKGSLQINCYFHHCFLD